MKIGDITKLVTAILIITITGLLAFYGKINEQAVTALLGAIIGYILGNGHAAVNSKIIEIKEAKKNE